AIDLSLRCYARSDESLLPLELALLEGERFLRGTEVGLPLQVRRLERCDLQRRSCELRFGLLDVNAERCVVESIEQVAAPHGLVVAYGELDDATGHICTDRGTRRQDISVFGLFVSTAAHVEECGEHDSDNGARYQQRQACTLPAIRRSLGVGSSRVGCGHLLAFGNHRAVARVRRPDAAGFDCEVTGAVAASSAHTFWCTCSSTFRNASRSALLTPAKTSLRVTSMMRSISSRIGVALRVRYSRRARRSAGSGRRSSSLSASIRSRMRTIIIGSMSVSSRSRTLHCMSVRETSSATLHCMSVRETSSA